MESYGRQPSTLEDGTLNEWKWFTLFLHVRIELTLTPDVIKYFSDVFAINSGVLKLY